MEIPHSLELKSAFHVSHLGTSHTSRAVWKWEGSFAAFAKIATDLFFCLLLLVILAPLMVAISLIVALDGGPVFYTHKRIGKGGHSFSCLKFRSMLMASDQALAEYLVSNEEAREEWRQFQKITKDPRITRVGQFLRATSLDELPQLFNVLRLQMSLVGPRPIVENELPRYGRNIGYYLQIRPGVTGLWQVSGRSNTTYARRVALDSWYVKNWRFWRDIGILFRTVSVVLRRDGAR